MKKIKVALNENSYPIFVGSSILNLIKREISKLNLNKNIFYIVDENVEKLHGKNIYKNFKNKKIANSFYLLKSGEKSKSYTELNKIYNSLLNNNYGRDTLIIAIGGGVTGDLAGYAASTYMRGIELVHIPTTLLACVDSSIGGKTGINFAKKKNMIGTFYQPKSVFIDTAFLSTLSREEKTSGIGEIIKYAFLSNQNLFNFVSENLDGIYENDSKILEDVILKSASIKAAVVSKDEKEGGLRKILNFGHTFAHAFESDLNFKIKHGEAVIAGIISALYLSNKIGILSKRKLKEYLPLPLGIKLPAKLKNINKENILEIMKTDKKSRSGKIKFVLLSGIGNMLIDVEAGRNDVLFALDRTLETL